MIDLTNKRVLIAGKGISGKGAYVAASGLGGVCEFSEDIKDYGSFKPDIIIVSPGIESSDGIFAFAQSSGIPIIGELEFASRICDKPIIAVTGTNGKTTVTKLIGTILDKAGIKAEICGNVGKSFAESAYNNDFDYAVVEVSSFQLETVRLFRPHIAVITNISPDHLNRHKTMQTYCKLKQRIALNQTAGDYLILSQDDIPIYALGDFAPKSQVLYTSVRGMLNGAYVLNNKIEFCGENICEVDRIKAEGEHNIKNALSAVAAAKLIGVNNEYIIDALTEFTVDDHRLRLVAVKGGKSYYNDSKGTNIMASVCAARCMSGSTCMIVGGSDKGYEYDELFCKIPACITKVAAMGAVADKVVAAALRNGFTEVKAFGGLADAFVWAASGDEENVLLSPASASFDEFTSYAERGKAFERLVHGIE